MIFGGSPNSRLFQRIRVKDGLSYGATAAFTVQHQGRRRPPLTAWPSPRPQNMTKVEADFNEELAKALKDGFTADEVEKAKKTWLDERAASAHRGRLHRQPARDTRALGPHPLWDAKLEAAVAALTPAAGQRRLQAATSIPPPSPSSKAATSRSPAPSNNRRCACPNLAALGCPILAAALSRQGGVAFASSRLSS